MDAILIQQKTLSTLQKLTKTTEDVGKASIDRDIVMQRTLVVLNNNIKNLGIFISDNIKAVTDYNSKNEKVINGLSDYFAVKREGLKNKLDPTNAIRSLFGIKNTGNFTDALLMSIEKRRALKRDRNEFAKDYTKFNKKGIAEKNFYGDKEAIKRGKELFDLIKATERQIARAQQRIEEGKQSNFNRPLKKDIEERDNLLKELVKMKGSGFAEPKIPVHDKFVNDIDKKLSQKSDNFDFSEQQSEQQKQDQEQMKLLQEIVNNTKPTKEKAPIGKNSDGAGGDFLGGILSGLGDGLGWVFKNLFSPKNLLKAFTKVFAPLALVTSLVDGFYEGFQEYKRTGDITKAVVEGVASMLNVLTLGLFGKDQIKEVLAKASDLVGEYIVDPVMGMFDMISDSFKKYISEPISNAMLKIKNFFIDFALSVDKYLQGITIPAIKLKIPGTDIGTTVGPWHPFDNAERREEIANLTRARNPDQAASVAQATQDARPNMKEKSAGNTAIVDNSNKTIQNNTNNFSPMKSRNEESTVKKYFGTAYNI